MPDRIADPRYEEVISRQQKRILELRNELAHYEAKLHGLRHLAHETNQSLSGVPVVIPVISIVPLTPQTPSTPNHQLSLRIGPMQDAARPLQSKIKNPGTGQSRKLKNAHERSNIKMNKCGRMGIMTCPEPGKECIQQTRYWTQKEHDLFLYATNLYGPKEYAAISKLVATRTPKQVRTHARKYQQKLERQAKGRKVQENAAAASDCQELASTDRNDGDKCEISNSRKENGAGNDDKVHWMNERFTYNELENNDDFMNFIA